MSRRKITRLQSQALRLRLDAKNALSGYANAIDPEGLVAVAELLEDIDRVLRNVIDTVDTDLTLTYLPQGTTPWLDPIRALLDGDR